MQRKAYVTGVAALLAVLLAGCTGGPADGDVTDGANPGSGTATAAAEPGRYRTLPNACAVVRQDTLDTLLPGIKQIADERGRDTAYDGEPTLTYDNDRKVGCRWKVESTSATDHLSVDFERVVSYDNAVSDDSQAEQLFAAMRTAADLPEPATPQSPPPSPSAPSSTPQGAAGATSSPGAPDGPGGDASTSPSGSPSVTPTDLQPRVLDGLGDEAYLDDELASSGSTAKQRTVTVAFRTSNVIVTVAYEEQPTTVGVVPDSKEMQDRARNLASRLADSLAE
ncbi:MULTISPECIES: hypothetical protein [Streptomyces]|uniref:DUF3558 domain-containing protein n=1 Tax=Streptomyces cadmiisoli TaxID=2184053 RepID=A0A2Z4J0F9_9ACTN|nr:MULTISPECIES: hypothetical protein [Streptomyces]AWW38268.1 DUF3558 domain-containing protein [Streptomyces cadmiisoli]